MGTNKESKKLEEEVLNEINNEKEETVEVESKELNTEIIGNNKEASEENKEVEVDENEEEGISKDLHISKETFHEFYTTGQGVKSFIRSSAIYCAIMIIVIYLFTDKSAEDFKVGTMIAQMGIYSGIVILVNLLMLVVTNYITIPRQYKKMGLETLTIGARFTNIGIHQTIEGHTTKIKWESIIKAIETEISFIFYANNRSGFVFSKDNLNEEEILYIREQVKNHVPDYKYETRKKDKK